MVLPGFINAAVEIGNAILVSVVATVAAVCAVLVVIDRVQMKDPLRHKFPLLARFTKQIDWLGSFWRSHGSAADREEMPINRVQAETLIRLGKGRPNIIGFGSSYSLRVPGTPVFVNAPFPPRETGTSPALVIGADCPNPYVANSIFNISAMSYGALSRGAVRALGAGAKLAGCWVDTGEGGLTPAHLEHGNDVIFQIGTAKYGVRNPDGSFCPDKLKEVAAHEQVRMIEIKLSQGAKPGEGGILPGVKVSEEIAAIRGIPVGKASISPPGHAEIHSVSDLLDFIARVRALTGKPTGFKTALSDPQFVEDLCVEIVKRGPQSAPDFITIDGGEGGSGAAPQELMDSMGLSIREALPMMTCGLVRHGLKERVRLIASGKLLEAPRVAWAMAAGADFVNTARGAMIGGLGCIRAKQCHMNTCPRGITTNNPELAGRLDVEAASIATGHLMRGMREAVETLAHSAGVSHARLLRPRHVHIVQADGTSKGLNLLYPELIF